MILGCELRSLDAMNNSGLYMTWAPLAREFKALDAMSTLGLWYMNHFGSWAQGTKSYELLKIAIDMNDSGSCAQGSRCYE